MKWLEKSEFAARFTHPVQLLIAKQDVRIGVDEGIEICDKTYNDSIQFNVNFQNLCASGKNTEDIINATI